MVYRLSEVDNWVRPLAPASLWPDTYLPFHVPGFGVVIVITGLTLLGFLAANIAGRTLVALYEAMLDRTPVVRGIYKSAKQIFETVFSQERDAIPAKSGWWNFRSRGPGRWCSSRPIPRRWSPKCCRTAA